jgi:CheY-like chemotaxis protein
MSVATVLLFDDDNFFRTLLADTLKELDFQVVSYPSPGVFLARLNNEAAAAWPDYILTDNQMPGMSGMEFVQKISRLGCNTPKQRIGIISGRWDNADLETARKQGYKIIEKYNSPDQIRAWVEETKGNF